MRTHCWARCGGKIFLNVFKMHFLSLALGRLLRLLLLSCWRWWVNTQLSQVTACCANTVATVEWGAARSSCEKRLFVKQWTDGRRVHSVFAERPLHTGPKARRDLIHLHRPFSLMRHSESLFILEVKSVRTMADFICCDKLVYHRSWIV